MRRLMLLGITLLLAAAVYLWGGMILRRVEMVYWQYRCTNYVAAPQQVALDARAGTPMPAPGHRDAFAGTIHHIPVTCRVPDAWEELYGLLTPGTPASSFSKGTVFLGRRRSAAGHERLVAVDVTQFGQHTECVAVCSHVIRLGSLTTEPASCTPQTKYDLPMFADPELVFFAAKADATDASRFEFHFVEKGRRSTIEGRLMDDDTVSFRRILISSTAPSRP